MSMLEFSIAPVLAHTLSRTPSGSPQSAAPPSSLAAMSGHSAAIQRIRRLIAKSAGSNAPILITGEVGVGKDLVAREIHRQSARRNEHFLELHCATLAPDFFDEGVHAHEATLTRAPAVRLELVDGGTLFLHDVDALAPVLQDQLDERLGGRTSLRNLHPASAVDFRPIGATHVELAELMATGAFSESLYYRLNVIHIDVPPLRTRLEDIPALVRAFAGEHAGSDGEHAEIPDELLAHFQAHDWPGNVRELENAVLRFMALGDPGYVLEELEASAQSARRKGVLGSEPPKSVPPIPAPPPLPDDLYQIDLKELGRRASDVAEREAILDMLHRTMGSKRQAAQRLGISYKALLYKIHDFGIMPSRGTSHRAASSHPGAA